MFDFRDNYKPVISQIIKCKESLQWRTYLDIYQTFAIHILKTLIITHIAWTDLL